MSKHLPKGDLKTLDNLALYLQEIMSLPKSKKLIVDPKMKIIGTDIKRSLAELLQGPSNFLQGEIELPDMENPASIKSFLYKMQGQGRRGRDQLNIMPGAQSSLINQHHIAGLMETMPNYAGKTAEEAFEIGKKIYEETGVWPGSHGGNLVEISGHKSIHLETAHGGSYTGKKIIGSAREMLDQTKGAIKLNLARAADAQKLTEPLYAWGRKMLDAGGFDPASKDPFYLNGLGELSSDIAGQARKAMSEGQRIIYGGPISNQQVLKEAGLNFNARGLGAVAGIALDPEAIGKAVEGDYTGAAVSAAKGEAISQGVQRLGIPAVKAVAKPIIKKLGPLFVNGAARLAPMIAPLAPVVAPLSIGATVGDLMNTYLPKTSHTSGRGAGRAAFNN